MNQRTAHPCEPASTSSPAELRSRWQGFAGGLRAAFMLLTRIPTGSADSSPAARAWASGWFPLVGVVIGAVSVASYVVCAALLGTRLAAVIAVAVTAVLTGALHEDGLADSADALGGARSRAQIFVILKDSRHGTYGVLALVLVVIVRIAALDRLGSQLGFPLDWQLEVPGAWSGPAAVVLAAVLSRTAMVGLLAALPYVTPPEVARSADVARTGFLPVALAGVLCAGICAALVRVAGLSALHVGVALAAAGVTAALLGRRFAVAAGGITGDFLGAGQQLSEVSVLLTMIALLR